MGKPRPAHSGHRPEHGTERRGGPPSAGGRPPARPERPAPPPGLAKKDNEPRLPAEGVDLRKLHRSVRAELRGLPKDLAEVVGSHLVLAGELVDTDPELAYAHADAARRRAARLPIVREATAETAYAAGRYDVALSEFRALRRMTGTHDYLPVMADCERALGRPQAALKLAKESRRWPLDPALAAEMTIVEAGARADLGQHAEARRILAQATAAGVAGSGPSGATATARLHYAYADALLVAGEDAEARSWFASAAELDTEQETDAVERRDALDGLLIEFDESEDTDQPGDSDQPGDGRRPAASDPTGDAEPRR